MRPIEHIQASGLFQNNINFTRFFLIEQKEAMGTLSEEMKQDAIKPDYSIPSIAPVIRHLSQKAQHLDPHDGLYEKTVTRLILNASYYMGESFIRSASHLSWDIKNELLPQIKGWKFGITMSPLEETQNIFDDILIEQKPTGIIEKKILSWLIKI